MKIYDLQFDDWNEAEFGDHHVVSAEILQVVDGTPVFLPNKKRHSAPILMVGPTFGGRFLTVPLVPIDADMGLWRPASAWDSDADELAKYRANRPRA